MSSNTSTSVQHNIVTSGTFTFTACFKRFKTNSQPLWRRPELGNSTGEWIRQKASSFEAFRTLETSLFLSKDGNRLKETRSPNTHNLSKLKNTQIVKVCESCRTCAGWGRKLMKTIWRTMSHPFQFSPTSFAQSCCPADQKKLYTVCLHHFKPSLWDLKKPLVVPWLLSTNCS